MKIRLLDILACPNDKAWPLKYYIFEEKRNEKIKLPPKDEKTNLICGNYCALHKVLLLDEKTGKITKKGKEISYEKDCKECLSREISAGMIECPSCNNYYPIIDEIPMMLKAELRNEDIEKAFTEKWSDKIQELLTKEQD